MLRRLIYLTLSACVTSMAYGVTFTVDNVDTANATCRISGITEHTGLPTTLTIPPTFYTNGKVCTVTEIAPNALNDLPGVTGINIPASITKIGEHETDYMSSDLCNFLNAPDLITFYVSPANEVYAHTENGMLVTKKGTTLLRCPARVKVASGGLLEMPAEIDKYPLNCFNGVTSVNKIRFAALNYIDGWSGLNLMPYLGVIEFTGETRYYYVSDNVLYSKLGALISFPPRKMVGTFAIPSGTKVIERFAFANAIYLSEVSIPSTVTDIRNAAFMHSSLRSLTIPATVNVLGTDVVRNCTQLAALTFNNYVKRVPSRFAMGCSQLIKVSYNAGMPTDIASAAYADCTSLSTHPLSASVIYGDSTFYNTGYVNAVFDNAPVDDDSYFVGKMVFGGCKSLEKIDMSAITVTNRYYTVGMYFAVDCPKLKEIIFPDKTYFKQVGWQDGDVFTFGEDCAINKVIIKQFNRQGSKPVFSWSRGGTVRPNIYLKLNGFPDGTAARTENLCVGQSQTTVKPIYYYERYAPVENYVDPKASYYVPGGCLDYFYEAQEAGCYVEEMYRFSVFKDPGGCLNVKLKEVYPDMIKLVSLRVNNEVYPLTSYGVVYTSIPYDHVTDIEMQYTAHGELMTTTYPISILAGVDDIEVDDIEVAPVYYDLHGRVVNAPAAGNLYIVKRGDKMSKEIYR